MIVASLESLREHNHYARYLKALDPAWCEPVLFCLASSWVPAELADAHYSALDALNLSSDQLSEVCDAVSSRLGGALMGSLLRSSRVQQLDMCPWLPLRQYGRMCERLLQGGAVSMATRGEREAVLHIRNVPSLRFTAFRQTMLALTRHAVGTFALRTFVRELPAASKELRIQVRWL